MTEPLEHGRRAYAASTLLKSSAARNWPNFAAALRLHTPIVQPVLKRQHVEISIATKANNAPISRRLASEYHTHSSQPGMIWLSPSGLGSDEVQLHAPLEILHLSLPARRFEQLSDACGGAALRGTDVGYISGFRDNLIQEIAANIMSEMSGETAAGRVLVDTLALALTARVAQMYAATGGARAKTIDTEQGLDDARLARVFDFMHAHIGDQVCMDDLASVVCLSPFHFARMFRARTGMPPYRYLAALRIERSKSLLSLSDAPLVEVAMAACFSTQANFTRAFKAATGMTPGDYRRRSR